MRPKHRAFCWLFALSWFVAGQSAAAADEPRVLQTLQDYESSKPGKLTFYRQPPGSQIDVIAAPDGDVIDGRQSLRVRLAAGDDTDRRIEWQIGGLSTSYIPPEADAIRAKVRVKSGTFTLTLGGPTVYFGNSDVNLAPHTLTADGKTYVVEWSLHHGWSRNFRRLSASLFYGRDMSFIHYPRWIQEPMRLNLIRPPGGFADGEMIIDSIELIARGEGRPFPIFNNADCVERGRIDFQSDIRSAFTFTLAVGRDIRKPAALSHETLPSGDKALGIACRFVEETSVVGIRVAKVPPAASNALAIDLRATHPNRSPVIVDVLLVVADDAFSYPGGVEQFDHDFSNPAMAGKNYALYHARRPVDPDRPGVVLPFADFACFFGQGTFRTAMTGNQPVDSASIVAVGILVPWQFNTGIATLSVDRLRWLSVPGEPASLRSYRQPTGKITLTRENAGIYGGTLRQEEADAAAPVRPQAVP